MNLKKQNRNQIQLKLREIVYNLQNIIKNNQRINQIFMKFQIMIEYFIK